MDIFLLELFQQRSLTIMKLNNDIIKKIKNFAIKNINIEVCGFVVEKDNIIDFVEIDNKHPDSEHNFLISPLDYLRIKKEYNILYLFHSHFENEFFSEMDLNYQKYHNIKMLLYIIKTDCFLEMLCK